VDEVLLQFDVSKCIAYDSFTFPNQVLNCSLLNSQFVPRVPNSSILYPISTLAQIPNYIGSPKKILHYVYFRSGKICLQHLYH